MTFAPILPIPTLSPQAQAQAALLANAQKWMKSTGHTPPTIASFSNLIMPLVRRAFPQNILNGSGIDYDTEGEFDPFLFDFAPAAKALQKLHNPSYQDIAAVLKEFKCNRPGVVSILIDVGLLPTVSSESDFYSKGLVGVQPMAKPSGLVYALRYRYAKAIKTKIKAKKKKVKKSNRPK